MFCGGKFCGKFPDEHAGDIDDDFDEQPQAEDSQYAKMVAKKKESKWKMFSLKKGPRKQQAGSGGGGQAAKLAWTSGGHLEMVKKAMKSAKGQETQMKVAILHAKHTTLKESALSAIPDVGQVHTVDLEDCRLTEVPPGLEQIETFCLLRLVRNKIRKIPHELGKCQHLETLNMAWNHIQMIDAQMFSEESFEMLEVLNMRHNKLSILPNSFGLTRKPNKIKHIDLSENSIQSLPEAMTTCVRLEFLDVSQNRLTKLPQKFNKFANLKKLFVSFNQLVELPEGIGDCTQLTHIRMAHNNVRRLPDSMLNLRATLLELDAEKNPLVVPSITTFTMGGLEQAFKLLADHVREKENLALASIENKGQLGNGQGQLENQASNMIAGHEIGRENSGQYGEAQDSGKSPSWDYYFSKCLNENTGEVDQMQIDEIRQSEATLLIIKKNLYFQSQVRLAKAAALGPNGVEDPSLVPNHLKKFLDPLYDVSKWHGVSCVTDLDLYFNLLVYSTKPLYTTCYTLFDKFETEGKGYLNKDEWAEFVQCSPVLLDDPKIHEGMWRLMAWRASDRINYADFVAAWHIHDIEDRDPQIERLTQVLRLDYYDMTIQELQNRLRSKDAEDATPQLDFDEDSSDDGKVPDEGMINLDRVEGERWVLPKSNYKAHDNRGKKKKKEDHHPDLDKWVSMTDAQYAEYQAANRGDDAGSEGGKSDISLQSEELSESSDNDGEFNVDENWNKMGQKHLTDGDKGDLVVRGDADVRALMDIEPGEFFKQIADRKAKKKEQRAEAQGSRSGAASRGKTKKSSKGMNDSRFKTDVYSVRQEIRRVFRNLPYDDFVKLINFLLRGMQMIKHTRRAQTFWHADDPSFKFTMGLYDTNLYTRRLLVDMGFAVVENNYWVWHAEHMKEVHRLTKEGVPVWGNEQIPRFCPGRNPDRLDDMIQLVRNCQKRLHKMGKNFNGNFP